MKTREQLNTDLLLNLNAQLMVNNILLLSSANISEVDNNMAMSNISEITDALIKNKEQSEALDKAENNNG